MKAVRITSLTKTYRSGEIYTIALNNVSMTIEEGEFVAIVGASGCGKTTLLNLIGGLDRPSEGKVYINDILINDLDDEELCVFRRENIGFVFQNYNLLPVLNVYENIVLPQKLDGCEIDTEFIEEIADFLEIKDKLFQMPNTLSGGQQQRVAVARALCMKPAIILADEPTGNLDSRASRKVIELIEQMSEKYKQTVVIVTHSEEIAKRARRIIRMEDGEVLNPTL
ncbi:MAG: ABC transporter ATP-binding protein [Acetatifactor sp.]|nr:ABC transporter ATP-binding protein [Acetatifactor sp.]